MTRLIDVWYNKYIGKKKQFENFSFTLVGAESWTSLHFVNETFKKTAPKRSKPVTLAYLTEWSERWMSRGDS